MMSIRHKKKGTLLVSGFWWPHSVSSASLYSVRTVKMKKWSPCAPLLLLGCTLDPKSRKDLIHMSLNLGRPKAEKTISFKFLEIIAIRKRPLTGIGKTCILPEGLRGAALGKKHWGMQRESQQRRHRKRNGDSP